MFLATAGILLVCQQAQAGDFFSNLFGGVIRPSRVVSAPLPFTSDGGAQFGDARPMAAPSSGGQAFCVRTCDGRYFPISANDSQTRAEACHSFCPAVETKIYRGSSIDTASADNGRPYSQLPNAFRYRNELVAGCTCNGKDAGGLAQIKVENDPTLRKGDIVAGANGLVVSGKVDRRSASRNFSPAPHSVRQKFERIPIVASD
jgi:hypothetical protein